MNKQVNAVVPVVQVVNNQTTTTSLNIAHVFGKEHKNVLQAIERLEVPEEFNRLNFQPVEYHDAKGEKRPMVQITRDGFTILVMGFTGPKAMKFKLAYIDAFNRMEEELHRRIDAGHLVPHVAMLIRKAVLMGDTAGDFFRIATRGGSETYIELSRKQKILTHEITHGLVDLLEMTGGEGGFCGEYKSTYPIRDGGKNHRSRRNDGSQIAQ